tara:strand:- start:134 stop:421 length:288 start_codon:yes stop_codon:yes gene_type:complete
VVFGVLTTDTVEQTMEPAEVVRGDEGVDCADAAAAAAAAASLSPGSHSRRLTDQHQLPKASLSLTELELHHIPSGLLRAHRQPMGCGFFLAPQCR